MSDLCSCEMFDFCSLVKWTLLLWLSITAPVENSTGRFRSKAVFECPQPYGMFANPTNCRRFYNCNNGVPYDTPCPTPLYFDDAKKLCVYKSKSLQCGPVAFTTPAPTTPDPNAAPSCIRSQCQLPDCFCSEDGTLIPGNLIPKKVPQMVILAFSGALNVLNAEPYNYLLNETRLNPNGCPVKATFFVNHQYNSYYYVQKLYGQGHEIAMQSITNREPEEWWLTAKSAELLEEVVGMKEILHKFANVSRDDLLGVRMPFLKPGGNELASVIYEYGLDYDSSLAAPISSVPLWPYTLDYRIPHSCLSKNCPTRSFPGIWELPLNTMYTDDGTGGSCVLLDNCVFPQDPEVVFEFLYHNFLRHYSTNRAPYVMNLHVGWVMDDSKVSALDVFIEHLLQTYPDVYFVTMSQALDWIRNPTPIESLANFPPWACHRREPGCNIPRNCALKFVDGDMRDTRYMQICSKCPARYPWLGNIRGTLDSKGVKDLVQKIA